MTDFETFTLDEILEALTTYREGIREWDPWINGKLDAAMEGLDPDIPEQLKKRTAVVDRFQWEHEIMVGQRMAVESLRYRFTEMVKQRRVAYVDAEPWTGLRPCCIKYVKDLDFHEAEYRDEERLWETHTHPLIALHASREWVADHGEYAITDEENAELARRLRRENAVLRARIEAGEYTVDGHHQCCPWDDRLDHGPFMASYQKLSEYFQAGGQASDLSFGPIEVIPER